MNNEMNEGNNISDVDVEISPGVLKPLVTFVPSVIERMTSDPEILKNYPFSTEIERKYAYAYTLVMNGTVEDPHSLLEGLVPTRDIISRSNISPERREEVLERGKKYKDSLTNLLVQKGLIEPVKWSSRRIDDEAPGLIINNDKLKRLIPIFGASYTTDILYLLDPRFRDFPHDRLKGLIADYLGDHLLQSGPLNLNGLKEALPFLSEPNLREGLVEVWKRDVLAKISDLRKVQEGADDRHLIDQAFADYQAEAEGIDDELFRSVFDEVKNYYSSLFDIQKPHQIVDSLNGDRPFPDLNQRINIKELQEKKRMLIADEMGLGKSASVILSKEILGVKNALVIAPSNVISVWQDFLSDKLDQDGKSVGYFRNGQAPRVLTVEDPQALATTDLSQYDYILLSHERLNDTHMDSLQNLDVGMLIVDEMHKLKNLRNGVRAGHLVDLARRMEGEDKYVALLSGTPIPNKVEDIAIALKLLYPEKFEDVDNALLIRSIIYGKIVDLRSLLLPRMQAKTLVESLEMPELTESIRLVELQGLEKDVYEELLNDDELLPTQKLQILRQFLLNPDIVDPTPEIEGSKIKALSEVIRDDLSSKDKVIVFVNDFTTNVIRGERSIIGKLGLPADTRIEVIDGPVSQNERQRIQAELKSADGKVVVFVSGQTADVGVDFSAAESVVFYNEPWSKFDKGQQRARVYRPGVKHPVKSTTLIGKGTIEEGINRYIDVKERAVLKLLRGIPRTVIENRILEQSEHTLDPTLGVNPELAAYYFSSWDRMNKIFAYVKEKGEDDFVKFLKDYAKSYAGAYEDLGSRSYQANASRVSGTLIDRFATESGKSPQETKILDIASGPETLRKHMPDGYEGNIFSLDINKYHFKPESVNAMVGSFLHLPIKDESLDYANLTLAWHYTAFAPSKENFERIVVLAEASRVLKKGGRLVLNNIYSWDIKNEQLFEEMVFALGFKIVPNYSGEISQNSDYKSCVFTLEKEEYPGLTPQEIAELIGKDHYDGLKFKKSDRRIRNSRKVLEEFSLNGTIYPLNLNGTDRKILEEERQITSQGEELIRRHGGIANIPRDKVINGEFARILSGNRFVLFKKLHSAAGAVVIK